MFRNRDLLPTLRKNLNRKEYLIITGARQVGKTTLLKMLYHECQHNTNFAFYLSLEDPELLTALNKHPENIFQYVTRPVNPGIEESTKTQRILLFLDEIQYLANPSGFLKYLFDTYDENIKIIATGSSAFYLSKNVKDSMAGRKRVYHLKSLNFKEFLEFRDASILLDELSLIRSQEQYISKHYHELLQYFNEFLIYGGYPALVLEKEESEKKEILFEIRNSFLKRDLLEAGIQHPAAFYNLIRILAGQAGNLVNRNELSRTLGLDNKTIENYLDIFERCFHISLVRPFSGNIRNELIKMPKVYFRDLGFRNSLLNRFSSLPQREDRGVLLENYLYNRLTDLYHEEAIKFWRTTQGNEVDFIIHDEFDTIRAIEVKFDATGIKAGVFNKLLANYPHMEKLFIAYTHDEHSLPVLKL